MNKIIFKKITFLNIKKNRIEKILNKKGLFLFPSGPGLSTLNQEKIYHKSLINADYVFFDSGFFVLLLKFFKNIKVHKISGYLFFSIFIKYLRKNKNTKILSVDPSSNLSFSNFNFFKKLGLKNKNILNYVAPIYKKGKIKDSNLVKIIKKKKPDFIILNIGGNVQEVLGDYINKKMKKKCRIFCTGAAISFFSGDQAPINKEIDKYYLGWLLRIIFKPNIFFKRYLLAFKLLFIVLSEKILIKFN